jgi:DtxR family Mn-dependent transcriptional regulator
LLSQANKILLVAIYQLTLEPFGQVRIKDIAASLGVTPPTVSEKISKLSKQGYIQHETYKKVTLTLKGQHIALQVLQKRDFISAFLQKFLNFSRPEAEEEACSLEPAVSERLAAAIEVRLRMMQLATDDHLDTDFMNNNA